MACNLRITCLCIMLIDVCIDINIYAKLIFCIYYIEQDQHRLIASILHDVLGLKKQFQPSNCLWSYL